MRKNSIKISFICVENAGRSQMAAAFAEEEKEKRDIDVTILMGGTYPAEKIHSNVIKVMEEKNIDMNEKKPRKITPEEVKNSNYAITMGCSVASVCPINWNGVNRDWELKDPGGLNIEEVRKIRDKIEQKVKDLFVEIENKYYS